MSTRFEIMEHKAEAQDDRFFIAQGDRKFYATPKENQARNDALQNADASSYPYNPTIEDLQLPDETFLETVLRRLPNIGKSRPHGWILGDAFFVGNSPHHNAHFIKHVRNLLARSSTLGFAYVRDPWGETKVGVYSWAGGTKCKALCEAQVRP